MEGNRNGKQRRLSRACEPNRLQDQLLALAYEQIWPLVRRAVLERQSVVQDEPQERLAEAMDHARRA
jgi:hypothetical protein